jgi:hypothetical protein
MDVSVKNRREAEGVSVAWELSAVGFEPAAFKKAFTKKYY